MPLLKSNCTLSLESSAGATEVAHISRTFGYFEAPLVLSYSYYGCVLEKRATANSVIAEAILTSIPITMLFCPTCANMLIISIDDGTTNHWSCQTCPYKFPITKQARFGL